MTIKVKTIKLNSGRISYTPEEIDTGVRDDISDAISAMTKGLEGKLFVSGHRHGVDVSSSELEIKPDEATVIREAYRMGLITRDEAEKQTRKMLGTLSEEDRFSSLRDEDDDPDDLIRKEPKPFFVDKAKENKLIQQLRSYQKPPPKTFQDELKAISDPVAQSLARIKMAQDKNSDL